MKLLPDPITRLLNERDVVRCETLIEDWQDEAAEASLDDKPRRSFYVQHMAERAMALCGDRMRANT